MEGWVSQQKYSVKLPGAIAIFSRSTICFVIGEGRDLGTDVNRIVYLTPHFAVTGALQPADFGGVAAQGSRSILSNLPDGESSKYPSSSEEARLAAAAHLGFRHVPATKVDVFSDRVVDSVAEALSELEGPVLAHCASGMRSAIAWASAAARSQPAACVIATLKAAGFDFGAIAGELEEQSSRSHAGPIPAALDCHCDGK
jgi:sulfide:quinone oxidoreductase